MKKMSKTIYISGKITGLPGFKEEFEKAENKLTKEGYRSLNPARYDIENGTWSDYMKLDIKMLLECDGIYMLPNYKESKGALLELHIAKELGLDIKYGL